MTKETFEYTVETCDICKRTTKLPAEKKEPSNFYYSLTNFSISTDTCWYPLGKAPSKTEHIDMCEDCQKSFSRWRAQREEYRELRDARKNEWTNED